MKSCKCDRMSLLHSALVPLLLLILITFTGCSSATILPSISWDPRNPMFSCDSLEILARVNDRLNLLCPSTTTNYVELENSIPRDEMFENAYLLQPEQESDYEACNATNGKQILLCDDTGNYQFYSFAFKEVSGSASSPIYVPGKTYYVIGTGTGTKVTQNNKVGGRCQETGNNVNKLKLKIRICSHEETNMYQNCTPCQDNLCYSKGCERYSSWRKRNRFLWNGTHCLQPEVRTCNSSLGFCSKSLERLTLASENRCNVTLATQIDCRSNVHRMSPSPENLIYTSVIFSTKIPESSSSLSPSLTSTFMMPASSPGCNFSKQSITVKRPRTERSERPQSTEQSTVLLVVPSILGGIFIGIALTVASKFLADHLAKRRVAPIDKEELST